MASDDVPLASHTKERRPLLYKLCVSMAEAEMNEALSAQFFHFPWKMVASDCLQGIEVASAAAAAVSLKNEQKDGQTESEGRRRFLLSFCLLL